MKNAYRVILIGLAVVGVVYAVTRPEEMTSEEKNKTIGQWPLKAMNKGDLKLSNKLYAGDSVQHEPGMEETSTREDVEICFDEVDICMFPVLMEVGHFVQVEKCGDYKIKLKQVPCSEIGQANDKFPCYEGCVTIKVRANFPAIFSASLNKSGGDVDMLNEMNLYWENGVNTIQGGTGGWEELKLYLEAKNVEIWKSTVDTVKVGEITIKVKPKDTQ